MRDLRQNKKKQGVELIVRPGNKYGGARAGESVLVDESELLNSSTRSACMTLDEVDALESARESQRREVQRMREAAEKSDVKNMVDAGLERIRSGGSRDDARVRLGKEREAAEEAARQAAERAAEETLEADRAAMVASAAAEVDRLSDAKADALFGSGLQDAAPSAPKRGRRGK